MIALFELFGFWRVIDFISNLFWTSDLIVQILMAMPPVYFIGGIVFHLIDKPLRNRKLDKLADVKASWVPIRTKRR